MLLLWWLNTKTDLLYNRAGKSRKKLRIFMGKQPQFAIENGHRNSRHGDFRVRYVGCLYTNSWVMFTSCRILNWSFAKVQPGSSSKRVGVPGQFWRSFPISQGHASRKNSLSFACSSKWNKQKNGLWPDFRVCLWVKYGSSSQQQMTGLSQFP